MNDYQKKWLYLMLLSLIWGSSFILIKKALLGLSPMQLGGLRITLASFFMFVFGYRSLKGLSKKDWKWLGLAGLLSSFFPPILFAVAQTEIDSGVAAIFNSVVPLFTTLVGIALFGAIITKRQILGVFVGLFGTICLVAAGMELNPNQNYGYTLFILASALSYSLNINIVKKHLTHLSALAITTASFTVVFLPALMIVLFSGFSEISVRDLQTQSALWYVLALAILATSIANILFNRLIHLSSPVFTASVTYTIPLVAILWAVWDGETINGYQFVGGAIILLGVWLVNKRRKSG